MGGHAVGQHGLQSVLLRKPPGEALPRFTAVACAVHAQLALRSAAILVGFHRNDISGIRVMRMDDDRKSKIRRHAVGDALPGVAAVIAAIHPALLFPSSPLLLPPPLL